MIFVLFWLSFFIVNIFKWFIQLINQNLLVGYHDNHNKFPYQVSKWGVFHEQHLSHYLTPGYTLFNFSASMSLTASTGSGLQFSSSWGSYSLVEDSNKLALTLKSLLRMDDSVRVALSEWSLFIEGQESYPYCSSSTVEADTGELLIGVHLLGWLPSFF